MVAVLLSAMIGLAGLTTPPAGAQQAEPFAEPPAGLSLEVLQLDGIVDAEVPLRLRVQVANSNSRDREELRVVATVHQEAIGRWNYQQAVDEGIVGNIVHPFVEELRPIPAGGSRTIELVQTAQELGLRGQPGVYPLRLQLLAGGEVADEVMTSIVVAPAAVENPLRVALLLPLDLPPLRDAEGIVSDPRPLRAIAPDGELAGTVEVLAASGLQATVGVDARTLADLTELVGGFAVRDDGALRVQGPDGATAVQASAFLERLSELVGRPGIEQVSLPYGAADLVALVRGGLPLEASFRHVVEAANEVEARTGHDPARRVLWPSASIDAATLDEIRERSDEAGRPVDRLVMSSHWLREEARHTRTPSPIRPLLGFPDVSVVVPDAMLEQPLVDGSRADAAVAAQRVLGELAAVYFEYPGTSRRGILLAPPAGITVSSSVVAALAGPLVDAAIFTPTTLTRLVSQVEPHDRRVALDYREADRDPELTPAYTTQLIQARRSLGSLAEVLQEAPELPPRLDRLLLQAASVHYRDDPPAGRELIRAVTSRVNDTYGAVHVLESPPVTLTAVEGELPVSLRSEADLPLRVLVTLQSARYEVEGGPTREVFLAPGSTEILTFGVRALTPGGTSPIQILVTDLDADVEITRGRVVVRSTAFSLVGLIVTAGAGVFLLLWWLREARRRRQPPPELTTTTQRGRQRTAVP